MDRLIGSAAFSAALLSLTLAACGGGGGTNAAPASSDGGTSTPTVQGISTPSSVSVVTAKNAAQ